MPLDFIPGGKTNFSLAGNWTETKVTSFDPTDPDELLSVTRVLQLEKNLPRYRGNASITHTADNWRALARVNYYGKYTEMHVNSGGLRIDAGSEITFDAELGYNITPAIELSVGAQNLLNNNPDINPYRFILGSKYPTTSPMGVNGGTYYARLQFQF
jgi:iron complex outermembrane receptor protein